ncbi:DUF6266 family protein [Sphingobacterium pedocola]|uniref:Uncharacterized protein n=1 Tax=Sphingobacterium pedocola TaxID=2082722 RepID=A0ABR9TAX8_9SPHI|nr:DUF6266 family protein [Sphingobacterium pedocola]MBE8722034.1 hypothetical protein [Sphingobacterium pedocola]
MECISNFAKKKTGDGTDGRLEVWLRFKVARQFLTPLTRLINMGFATKKRGKTPLGRAMSYTLKGCMEGTYPDIRVNPELVQLSNGSAVIPLDAVALRQDGVIQISWRPDSDGIACFHDDGVIVCAYHVESAVAGINETTAIRSDGRTELVLPVQLVDKPVHVYAMAHCRHKKNFSRTVYLGEH